MKPEELFEALKGRPWQIPPGRQDTVRLVDDPIIEQFDMTSPAAFVANGLYVMIDRKRENDHLVLEISGVDLVQKMLDLGFNIPSASKSAGPKTPTARR